MTTQAVVSKSLRKPNLPALTGIRTLAAINIMLFHFSDPKWFGPLATVVDHGYAMVNFFFLLSGFILAYNYADRAQTLNLRAFWLARFSRLYPVYLVALLISWRMLLAEWHYHTHALFALGAIMTPLLIQGWHPSLATFWNTPAWTLSCEVSFYLLFPWLIRLPWPKKVERLLLLLLVFWLAALLLPSLYMWIHPDGILTPDRYSYGFWLRAVKLTPPPHFPAFLFGIVLARLHTTLQLSHFKRFLLAMGSLPAVYLAFLFADHMPYILLHNGLLMPLYAMVILGLAGEHFIASIFAFGPLVLLGEASYSLYILHFNLWELIHQYKLLDIVHLGQFDPWLSYVLLILAAVAAYKWVELPGRRFILWLSVRPAK
ncbi:MAG: acyltransferase family protein [Acidobacteriaceae bacterium]